MQTGFVSRWIAVRYGCLRQRQAGQAAVGDQARADASNPEDGAIEPTEASAATPTEGAAVASVQVQATVPPDGRSGTAEVSSVTRLGRLYSHLGRCPIWWVFAVFVIALLPGLPGALLTGLFDAYHGLAQAVRSSFSSVEQVRITVQSPSVQTRERLLNDRFEQVAWTDMLLKHTMQLTPQGDALGTPRPAASGEKAEVAADGKLPPAAKSEPPADEKKRAELGVTSTKRSDVSQYGSERTDWFKLMRGFRDIVRSERFDAMLDDRHDLDGNTLYNLTFNTTLIPTPGARRFAAVRVLLTHDPSDIPHRIVTDDQPARTRNAPNPKEEPPTGTAAQRWPGEDEAMLG
jgi:hypothetical protein